jgi:serine/threonine protein kinase
MEEEKYCPRCFTKFPSSLKKCPKDGQHLVCLMERDLTGEVLDDRYTVMGLVGRGGMGVVYKAEQHLIKRIVALKVLRREVVQDETSVKRFLNEARAIASLQNPHTITLHDFGVTHDGLLYYTMELLKGNPLSMLIKNEAPIDYQRAAGFIIEACDSLQEAHENNILHRDLKPDNLFVIKRWDKEHIKVLDFGIAKLVGDTSMETVTKTGMVIGTPRYLSPEQAQGNPTVPASDLYSLAIVLYEMLTGSPPFTGETPLQTMWKHLQEEAPPIFEKNPSIQVPKSIDLFLRKALQKEPDKRPGSALAFRKALERALQEHDATPETVSVTSLNQNESGVRVLAETIEQEDAGAQAVSMRNNLDNETYKSIQHTESADIEVPKSNYKLMSIIVAFTLSVLAVLTALAIFVPGEPNKKEQTNNPATKPGTNRVEIDNSERSINEEVRNSRASDILSADSLKDIKNDTELLQSEARELHVDDSIMNDGQLDRAAPNETTPSHDVQDTRNIHSAEIMSDKDIVLGTPAPPADVEPGTIDDMVRIGTPSNGRNHSSSHKDKQPQEASKKSGKEHLRENVKSNSGPTKKSTPSKSDKEESSTAKKKGPSSGKEPAKKEPVMKTVKKEATKNSSSHSTDASKFNREKKETPKNDKAKISGESTKKPSAKETDDDFSEFKD